MIWIYASFTFLFNLRRIFLMFSGKGLFNGLPFAFTISSISFFSKMDSTKVEEVSNIYEWKGLRQ